MNATATRPATRRTKPANSATTAARPARAVQKLLLEIAYALHATRAVKRPGVGKGRRRPAAPVGA